MNVACAIRKPGTAAYLKVGYHAPAVTDPSFFPLLILDAVLTGAKGMNLWSSFRMPPPQRRARLYRALVETRARLVRVRCAAADRAAVPVHGVGDGDGRHAARPRSKRSCSRNSTASGVTASRRRSSRRRKRQLRARLVFDDDSITNIAHQLGYFRDDRDGRHVPGAAATGRCRDGRAGGERRAERSLPMRTGPSAGSTRSSHDSRSWPRPVAYPRRARQRGRHPGKADAGDDPRSPSTFRCERARSAIPRSAPARCSCCRG